MERFMKGRRSFRVLSMDEIRKAAGIDYSFEEKKPAVCNHLYHLIGTKHGVTNRNHAAMHDMDKVIEVWECEFCHNRFQETK